MHKEENKITDNHSINNIKEGGAPPTQSYNTLVKILSKQEDNRFCMDCNCVNPQWASITHGIFICLECASNHRSFGVQISKVRSVNMDQWDEKTYTIISLGGNKKLKDYMKNNNITNIPVKEKYRLKEVIAYTEMLEDEVHNKLGIPKKDRTVNKTPQITPVKRTVRHTTVNYNINKNTMDKITTIIKENAMLIKDKSLYYTEIIHETVIKPTADIIIEKGRTLYNKMKKEELQNESRIQEIKNIKEFKPKEEEWDNWE